MCGVIAFACESPDLDHLEILLRIYEESQIRGTHSFGYSSGRVKRFHSLEELKVSLRQDWPIQGLIGHNRYSTGESWRNLSDCQPLPRGGMSIAFNGVIDMSSPSSWSATYGVDFETSNDAEIALVKAEEGALLDLLQSRRVSFAGAWTDGERIEYARNPRRPLWRAEKAGAVFLASTRDIFVRAGVEGAEEVEPYGIFSLN